MKIIQPKIKLTEEQYIKYCSGEYKLKGLLKDSNNNRIIKHLDVFQDKNQDDAKSEVLFGLIALSVVAVSGITLWFISRTERKKVDYFKSCLNTYIDAVKKQKLTVEIIDNLIKSVDELKIRTRKNLNIKFSKEELFDLIECLCNHTKTLAQSNNINLKIKYTDEENLEILLKLRKNLNVQKKIFLQAA